MPRAIAVHPRGAQPVVDTVLLDHRQRRMQRGRVIAVNGLPIDFDFAEPVRLRTDDRLQLETGELVEVVAEAEPLLELRAADADALAKLAWLLGDHHIAVQVLPHRLRILRTEHAIALLTAAGAAPRAISAPFEPEGGAYAPAHSHDQAADDHHHHHGHDHGD